MAKAQQRGQSRAKTPRRARSRQGLWVGAGVLAVVVAGVVGYLAYRAAADLPGVLMPDLGNLHIQSANEPHVPYNSDPPTSGPHLPYLAPWGVHTAPVPKELQVHNLEDGGVVVQYSCPAGCPELVAKLTELVKQYDKQVLLAPYPGLRQRIALTAWTRIETFDEFDQARIQRFIRTYRGIDHHKR
jgi:hypothetical protein